MTSHYKGVRIDELLEDIARLQEVLEATKHTTESAEEALQVVAGEATLAIMKAKLTALSADEGFSGARPRKPQGGN